ncbi:O-antigen ligase [Variovorax boronicumulans]|uniref:PglL family O-oligosaccharyltransferase n=1 Tax=Variovorax boronicumulans TaxID=436515 RepID=UPI0033978DC8
MTFAAASVPSPSRDHASRILGACLVAFPFVCPFAAGPSAGAWQLFASGLCAALFLLLPPACSPMSRGLMAWLGLCVAAVALSGQGAVDARLLACAVLAAIGVSALTGAALVRMPLAREALAWGVLAAAVLNAVLGLLQYFDLAETLLPWVTSPTVGRAWGTLRQRNQFATLISLGFVAALWLYAARKSRREPVLVGGVLLLVATAASGSRTGLLQIVLIAGGASLVAWRQRRTERQIGPFSLPHPLALLSMLPLYFVANWLLPRLAASGSANVLASAGALVQRLEPAALGGDSRVTLWRNVLSLISERPLTGWGWGELSFAHFATLYSGPRFPVILDNAHNLPLHLAVELGIPAALLICGGFLWMVGAAKPWRERDPLRLMAWGLLGVILLHSLLEYPLWYGPFQLVFGLCLGILWPASSKRPEANGRKLAAFAAAAAWVALIGYAAWDYTRISQIYLPRDTRMPAYRDDTLAKLRGSWLFSRQVDFAEVTLTSVTPANAAHMHDLAGRVLHFSPEPRVIVKLIESAELLDRDAEAHAWAERFRVAFPAAFARWLDNRPDDAPEL